MSDAVFFFYFAMFAIADAYAIFALSPLAIAAAIFAIISCYAIHFHYGLLRHAIFRRILMPMLIMLTPCHFAIFALLLAFHAIARQPFFRHFQT